jgi:dipeptidase E
MPNKPRQIIAMGGGGFSMEPENLTLDRYVLAQARTKEPRVSFLPTAKGDADSYLVSFYTAFCRLPCQPSHLTFFRRTPDLREYVLSQDVIYVGGGNTKSMLGVWREWGLPEILREAWEAGIVLAGLSAGAICWFEQGLTDSFDGELRPLQCLGLLKGSACPHYDGDSARRPTYHHLVHSGVLLPGLALDDGAAVHFMNDDIEGVVASRPGATAYRVRRRNEAVEEEALPVEFRAEP